HCVCQPPTPPGSDPPSPRPRTSTLSPYTTLFRSIRNAVQARHKVVQLPASNLKKEMTKILKEKGYILNYKFEDDDKQGIIKIALDRKSTRLNSSHVKTSYAVFCLKNKNHTSHAAG